MFIGLTLERRGGMANLKAEYQLRMEYMFAATLPCTSREEQTRLRLWSSSALTKTRGQVLLEETVSNTARSHHLPCLNMLDSSGLIGRWVFLMKNIKRHGPSVCGRYGNALRSRSTVAQIRRPVGAVTFFGMTAMCSRKNLDVHSKSLQIRPYQQFFDLMMLRTQRQKN